VTDQTLYTCVNDFVDPKLKQVSGEASRLHGKSNRSSAEEKNLEQLSDLELELKDFRDELLRIAKFWKPKLNDGVQITAAPLWNFLPAPTVAEAAQGDLGEARIRRVRLGAPGLLDLARPCRPRQPRRPQLRHRPRPGRTALARGRGREEDPRRQGQESHGVATRVN
jgi:hypothetical protein